MVDVTVIDPICQLLRRIYSENDVLVDLQQRRVVHGVCVTDQLAPDAAADQLYLEFRHNYCSNVGFLSAVKRKAAL